MGRLMVQQALQKGHLVTAFVRSPEKFDIKYVYSVNVCTYARAIIGLLWLLTHVIFIHMFLVRTDARRCWSMVLFRFFRFNLLCMIKHRISLFIYQTSRTNLSYLKKKKKRRVMFTFVGLCILSFSK